MIVTKRTICDHERTPSENRTIRYRVMVLTISLLLACTPAYPQQVKQFVDEGLAAFDRGEVNAIDGEEVLAKARALSGR